MSKYEEKIMYKIMDIEQEIKNITASLKKNSEAFNIKEKQLKQTQDSKHKKMLNAFETKVGKLYEKRRKLQSNKVVYNDILKYMTLFPDLQDEIYKLYMFSKTKKFNTFSWMTNSLVNKYAVNGNIARNVYNTNKKVLVMELNGELDILNKNSHYFNGKRPSSSPDFTYGNARTLLLVKPGLSSEMKKV